MLLFRLLLRNAFRHRLRTFLTITGITIAILAFGILRTVVDAWYAGVEAAAADRLVTRNAISLMFPLPVSYSEKIRQTEGVKRVSGGTWFAGIYISEKNFFANFAIQPETYLPMLPEFVIDPKETSDFLKDRKGALVGIKLAERFGWKVGDAVTLRGTIYPGNWDFVIRAIYRGRDRNVDESQFLFNWKYLNETLKKTESARADHVGFYLVQIKDPDEAGAVSERIDSMFRNSLAETLTETEKAFQMSFVSMTEAIMMAIQLVSIVVIFIIMAVMANTMAMSVRERMGEYAVFKTLGFGAASIIAMILGESVVITLAGSVAGIALTFPAAAYFKSALGQYFPIFIVKKTTLYLDVAASFAIAFSAVIIPAYRAVSVPITDALRKIG